MKRLEDITIKNKKILFRADLNVPLSGDEITDYSRINIIIPSIGIDDRLLRCLDGISKQSFKQFFVTIILECH